MGRRRPRTGAARSGSSSSSSGIVQRAPTSGEPASAGSRWSGEIAAAASSGAAPTVHPEKGAAGTGWIHGNPTKAATASKVPTVHPRKGAVGTVSSGEVLDKKAATVGGAPTVHPGKLAAGSGSGSTGDMLPKKAAVGSSGGAPMSHPGKGAMSSVSSGGILKKKAAVASIGGTRKTLLRKKALGTGSSEEMPKKKATALSGDSPTLGALDGNTPAQDCGESVAKHSIKKAHTLPSVKIPQKHCTEDKAEMGLSRGMVHKQISKVEADTGLSEEMLHEHLTKETDTAKNIPESDSDEIVHVSEEDTETKEAELLIKELNELCIGEPFSEQEFLGYFDNLACDPPRIDLKVQMSNEELAKQDDRHALCRLRYYQYKLRQASKEELCGDELKRILDISENDCTKEFLKKEGFFNRFEEDKTFDWVFHPDYVYCSLLDDYQHLVLKNHSPKFGRPFLGKCRKMYQDQIFDQLHRDIEFMGYSRWSEYHKYLHSYEIEQEYVNYCEELSKQLKWMEPYVDTDRTSVKWGKISCRGALQAFKIAATSFHKITSCLAFNGYYECKESMGYDVTWFKEFDGVYFEIWRRVTHGMSFEKALEEVYNLNRFPLRQPMMKAALEFEETMQMMQEEFLTCTEDITPEVKEDEAKKLIKEAVDKRVQKPKSYEQYIRKKMHIAHIIGILG